MASAGQPGLGGGIPPAALRGRSLFCLDWMFPSSSQLQQLPLSKGNPELWLWLFQEQGQGPGTPCRAHTLYSSPQTRLGQDLICYLYFRCLLCLHCEPYLDLAGDNRQGLTVPACPWCSPLISSVAHPH